MITRWPAPAKLTLSLRITGVRADGYHEIDAEMVSLDLADELLIDDTPAHGATGAIHVVDGSTGRVDAVPADRDNLVARALHLVGRDAQVRLTKHIPPGAGLGGGSSDAAAALRWAGCTDLLAAARLGADVPFCLVGGRARVRGIGEIVDPLPMIDQTLTLVMPPFGCSTPAVYAAWDRLGGPQAGGDDGNDLEAAALAVEPRLAPYRDALGDATGVVPRLAGSGSTWFVSGAHPGRSRVVVRTVGARSMTPSTVS